MKAPLKRPLSRLVLGRRPERDNEVAKQLQITTEDLLNSSAFLNSQNILKHSIFWKGKSDNLKNIKSLILSQKQLYLFSSTLSLDLFSLANIQILSLSKNKLTSLHFAKELTTLTELNVNFNCLQTLFPLGECSGLTKLMASHNQISDIDQVRQLKELQYLTLYKNKLNNPEKVVHSLQLSPLIELDIAENKCNSNKLRADLLRTIPSLQKLNQVLITQAQKESLCQKRDLGRSSPDQLARAKQANYDQLQVQLQSLDNVYEKLIEENAVLKLQLRQATFLRKQDQALHRQNKKLKDQLQSLLKDKGELIQQLKIKNFYPKIEEHLMNLQQNPNLARQEEQQQQIQSEQINALLQKSFSDLRQLKQELAALR